MIKYIEHLKSLADTIGVPMITAELEIILHLYVEGAVSSRKLMGVSRLSPAGFHIVRKRLVDLGLIHGRKSDEDSRKTLYDLSPDLRSRFATIAVGGGEPGAQREIGRAA